jgi:hypothetical protein
MPRLHRTEKYERPVLRYGNFAEDDENRDKAILRFIEGIDDDGGPQRMDDAEIVRELNDVWAVNVLRQDRFPKDIVEVLTEMKKLESGDAPLTRRSFLVGEGGQIPKSVADVGQLNRTFRYVVSWSRGRNEGVVFLSIPAGSRTGLTELIAWDNKKLAFNFYRRESPDFWLWRGETRHAFDSRSAGRGCFACHPNGTLLIKELERPWQNWHSELAGISSTVVPEALRPADAPELKALFDGKAFAQDLEALIANGIERSNSARVASKNGKIPNIRAAFRQFIGTNNCNLRASEQKAIAAGANTLVSAPKEFFFDERVFDRVLDLEVPGFTAPIPWPIYEGLVRDFEFTLSSDGFDIQGDSFFLFLAPVPAFEDANLLSQLLQAGLVTKRFAICISMVDFPNPVFSRKRDLLLMYVEQIPDSVHDSDKLAAERKLAEAILEKAEQLGRVDEDIVGEASAEQQFAYYWSLSVETLKPTAETHLAEYLRQVMERSRTAEGRRNILRLLVSRRRQFQRIAPGSEQAEFPLLFPRSNFGLKMGHKGSPVPDP